METRTVACRAARGNRSRAQPAPVGIARCHPTQTSNRLGEETSPYLLQHKDNPVHWQAWNAETLAAAKAADKPILLSVGYAACHWCHVMAHESFENPQIAAQMNERLRQHQGRPRGAPRPRRDLPECAGDDGRAGRLAADDVPDPRGRAVLGRHLFPARAALGPAELSAGAGLDRRRLPRQEGGRRQECRGAAARAAAAQPAAARRGHRAGPVRPRRRAAGARGRPAERRHRHGAEIPAMRHLRAVVAGLEAHRPRPLPRGRRAHPDDDQPGRHLRPSRRRLFPLRHRHALAGAAFREDAVRQRRAGQPVDAGVAGDARPALRAAGRRDDRLARARDDPSRRRLLQQPRRRQRARGRQVLRLVGGRDRRVARRPGRRCSSAITTWPAAAIGKARRS